MSEGAQPTERVAKLLEVSGAMAEFKAAGAANHDDGAHWCTIPWMAGSRDSMVASMSSAPTAVAVLTHIVKSIVDDPESVVVDEVESESGKHAPRRSRRPR